MGAQAVRLSNVDIDNALRNRDFEVLFQPIFDLGNGALARVETFVRWRHPTLGLLPPGAFISFFESQGRMSELTRYVLDQALSEYREWRGPSAPGFSINLALSDLADEAFTAHFEVALRDKGFPADLITLECPMPPVTMSNDVAAAHFQRLAQTGARLAIEVRGRANDFLRTIDPFPFDEIKTGGAAILRFARTVRGPGLSAISELLEIAAKVNAPITAVGVEDQASLSALRGLGFAAAQGNHLSKVGMLSAFTPSRVNEVRTLLGLDPLSNQDLHALFRTEVPAPAHQQVQGTVAVQAPGGDALVERLAARVAEQVGHPIQTGQQPEPKPDRAAAKAAAIKRAKQKKAAARVAAEADAHVARDLQDRLSREFEAAAFAPESEFSQGLEQHDGRFAFASGPADTSGLDISSDIPVLDAESEPVTVEATATAEIGESDFEELVAAAASEDVPQEDDVAARMHDQAAAISAVRASLAVGQTRAYFRPAFRIGVARPAPDDGTTVPKLREGPLLKSAAAAPTHQDPEPTASEIEPGLPSSPPADEVQIAPGAPDGASRRKLKKKSFLTRTLIPWPTHFWPRSWTRAWRRREVMQARKRAEQEVGALE